jgi:acetylornithine deacetylase/succinyl-diaminopimelate desuccinylase-like protein
MARLTPILLTLLSLARPALGAESPVQTYVRGHQAEIVNRLETFLRLPNVATDRTEIRRNANALVALMHARHLEPRLLDSGDSTTPPAIYGERLTRGANPTIVFYAHYDGQPVDATEWQSDPWVPTWRNDPLDAGAEAVTPSAAKPYDPDWRLVARSASDDKAGVIAILTALDALDAVHLDPTVNLKFFFEGEEEQGSPNLRATLERNRDLLAADAWLICDGPVHPSGAKQVLFGVRGDANVDLTVYGPKRPLHSGHYGNWAPNPALLLAKLLASMKDDQGRVVIDGWYDDVEPLGPTEIAAMKSAPQPDEDLRKELGLARTDLPDRTLLEAIILPSLNINGLRAANVGEQARNVIPTEAAATLDLRLVKGNTPERQFVRLVRHIERQGYFVIDGAPTDAERLEHPRIAKVVMVPGGYAASRTRMDTPLAQAVITAIQSTTPRPVVALPTLGGSLPLVFINDVLGADTVIVPIANHDNNQHAENENLRIGNLWDGIAMMAALMRMQVSP